MKSSLQKEVIVLSTSIRDKRDVEVISEILDNMSGIQDWSVDLEDWEKVLRVEGINLNSSDIKRCLLEKSILAFPMHVD